MASEVAMFWPRQVRGPAWKAGHLNNDSFFKFPFSSNQRPYNKKMSDSIYSISFTGLNFLASFPQIDSILPWAYPFKVTSVFAGKNVPSGSVHFWEIIIGIEKS